MFKSTKILLAVGTAGVIAVAGGSAFTAANTVPNTIAGTGTSTISGATVNSIKYTSDGTTITASDLTLAGNMTGKTVKAGFGTGTSVTCVVGATGADDPNTAAATDAYTAVSCTGFSQAVSSSSTFNITVTS